jgi:hypothetical protein
MAKQTNVRLSEKAKEQIKQLRERFRFLKSDAATIEYALDRAVEGIAGIDKEMAEKSIIRDVPIIAATTVKELRNSLKIPLAAQIKPKVKTLTEEATPAGKEIKDLTVELDQVQ